MAHYSAQIETTQTPAEVFAYLSDFSSTEEWDPGIVEAERVGDAPVGEGTEFRLVAEFLGRRIPLSYRMIEYEPPSAVTLRAESATVVSEDRITFEPSGGGTLVTYDADLALKGPLRLADPLLGPAFKRVGDRAHAGLRRTLGTDAPWTLPALSGRALDGEPYELPDDLYKPFSFIVLAFRRAQQTLVGEWLPWLLELEQSHADVAIYELPVLSYAYTPARRLIDGGMARGVPTVPARARTITVYTDVTNVVAQLGLPDTETVAVALVDPSGRVLAREIGGFDQHKADRLAMAI